MYQIGLSNYISGIMNLASSLSTWIGPSYIEVECYKKENALLNFIKEHHLSKKEYEWEELEISFENLLKALLGEEKQLIESIIYWITFHIGEPIKINTPKDRTIIHQLGRSEGEDSPFYIVDDLYWIEFKDYIVFFIIGNNE